MTLSPSSYFPRSIPILALSFLLISCGGESRINGNSNSNSTDQYQQLEEAAASVYIYGFPIVENYNFISDHLASSATESTNTFNHKSELLTPNDQEIINPNNDTLNSSVVFDLRAEPIVLEIPEITDRYFSIQLINLMTENIAILSTESEGAMAKNILLAGPNWDDSTFENTENFEILQSDSELLVGFMRIGVDSVSDLENAQSVQQLVNIATLSEFQMLPNPEFIDSIDWPEAFNAKTNTSLEFFNYVDFLLQFHELDDANQEVINQLSILGVESGTQFDESSFSAGELESINVGVNAARQAIMVPSGFTRREGWNQVNPNIGTYGEDHILRAVIGWYGLYAMSPGEVVYFNANADVNGNALDAGSNNYVLALSEDQIPPAEYFWSITIYNENRFLVDNELNRYSLGDRSDSLTLEQDGSLNIYIQSENPGEELAGNWLPAPESGRFFISIRLYGPSDEVLSGQYALPGITPRI